MSRFTEKLFMVATLIVVVFALLWASALTLSVVEWYQCRSFGIDHRMETEYRPSEGCWVPLMDRHLHTFIDIEEPME